MKTRKTIGLLVFLVIANSVFAEMTWNCISLGASMPGTTCQICAFTDEDGDSVGGSVVCN